MSEMLSFDHALVVAQEVADFVNNQIPRFDIKQTSLAGAIGSGGNCLARVKLEHVALEDLAIPHFFQYIRKRSGGFPHSQTIIPVDIEEHWGVVIDTSGQSHHEKPTFARPSYENGRFRQRQLSMLKEGRSISVLDDLNGYLKKPKPMDTLNYYQGLESYLNFCRRAARD